VLRISNSYKEGFFMSNNSMKRKIGKGNIIGGSGNIITPDQLNPEQIIYGLIHDISKIQVLLNELIVRYNGIVNLLISKDVFSEEELQKSIESELQKLKESVSKVLEEQMNEEEKIIVPEHVKKDEKENEEENKEN
jgi:hypothetical protein